MNSNLEKFFQENFVEGRRYELVMRLAGSCALAGVPMQDCIDFYLQYRDRDDEDRTYLIKRTYRKVAEGKKVIQLHNVDVAGYFEISPLSKNTEKSDFEEKIKQIRSKFLNRNKNSYNNEVIDLMNISIKFIPKFHTQQYIYLLKRKLNKSDIKRYNIRIGIKNLQDRIVFPIFNQNGDCIYYVARTIKENEKPKYLNAKAPKENVIWNYWNCDFSKPVIVCEGIFNAISAYKYTNIQSVATLGKYLTETQKLMLSRFPEVILCFDGDVDMDYQYQVAESISTDVYIIEMPEGKDVNDMDKEEFLAIFNSKQFYDGIGRKIDEIKRRLYAG